MRKERLEAEFEGLLADLRPSCSLFDMAEAMLRDLWEQRINGKQSRIKQVRTELARIEHKSDQIMERLIAADNTTLILAYENQIKKLEERKVALSDQLRQSDRPAGSFQATFRTACAFLANPCNLWASDRLEDKRLVLKLAFGSKLAYDRKEGFRTALHEPFAPALTA